MSMGVSHVDNAEQRPSPFVAERDLESHHPLCLVRRAEPHIHRGFHAHSFIDRSRRLNTQYSVSCGRGL